MIIGQRFWVSDYFSGQDDYLAEFEVTGLVVHSWFREQLFSAKLVDTECPISSSTIHYFTEARSPDVLSSRVLKTPEEVKAWEEKRKDYEERREKARAIFPEGFE